MSDIKLIASLICKNEVSRGYLPLVIEHLLEFCDEVRAVDDYSTDGTYEFLERRADVEVSRNRGSSFDEHEGNARNELLRWTLLGKPSHVLAIDCDELVSDGAALRAKIEQRPAEVYTLMMEEVWEAGEYLRIRHDGGWRPHRIPILYRAPTRMDRRWQIMPRKLACGREPQAVRMLARRAVPTDVSIYHFGWTRESERRGRYDRYMQIDGGNFHNNQHLQSIMWPANRIILREEPWPLGLEAYRESLLDVTRSR